MAINVLYIGHIVAICNNEIVIYFIDIIPLYNDNYFGHCEFSHREHQLLDY